MARQITNQVTISDPITLADLRWLVQQCEGMDEKSQVTIQGRREFNQRDFDPAMITVHGKPK